MLESLSEFDFLVPYIQAVLVLIIGLIVLKIFKKVYVRILKKIKIEAVAYKFIEHVVEFILWVAIILTMASSLGFEITSLLTVLAAAGAAVALAIQDSLASLFGGFIVMASDIFDKGDYVQIGTAEGTVEATDLLYTTIITPDRKIVTIPNSVMNKSVIYNFSKSETRRIEFQIGISYDSDSEQARYVLTEMAKQDKRVLSDPAPVCHVTDYADSAVMLSLKVFVRSEDFWDVTHYLKDQAKATLSEAGVVLPYPQLDVHFDEGRKKKTLK